MAKNEMGAIRKAPVHSIDETFRKFANQKDRGVSHKIFGLIRIKKDSKGWIMVPDADRFKSGWGLSPVSCFQHFKARNAGLF